MAIRSRNFVRVQTGKRRGNAQGRGPRPSHTTGYLIEIRFSTSSRQDVSGPPRRNNSSEFPWRSFWLGKACSAALQIISPVQAILVSVVVLRTTRREQEHSSLGGVHWNCEIGSSIAREAMQGQGLEVASLDQNGRAFPGYSEFLLFFH